MLMPSGLEYNQKPGYERREIFQHYTDATRGGGLLGDSDLSLQLILGQMELSLRPLDSDLQMDLNKLYKLLDICEENNNDSDRGYHLEAKLLIPKDISDALHRHQI